MSKDELVREEIRSRAKRMVLEKGWHEGASFSLHTVLELMTEIAVNVLENHPEPCNYPDCGCEADSVCVTEVNARLENTSKGSYEREIEVLRIIISQTRSLFPQITPYQAEKVGIGCLRALWLGQGKSDKEIFSEPKKSFDFQVIEGGKL